MLNKNISFEAMSEAQIAMFKTHVETLLKRRFKTANFHSTFDKLVGKKMFYSRFWFDNLEPIEDENLISDIQKIVGRTTEDIFIDMPIVISKKNTATELSLDFDNATSFPHVFRGTDVFLAVSNYSLAALYAFEPSLPHQLWNKEYKTSFSLNGEIESAAKSGHNYVSTDYDEYVPTIM